MSNACENGPEYLVLWVVGLFKLLSNNPEKSADKVPMVDLGEAQEKLNGCSHSLSHWKLGRWQISQHIVNDELMLSNVETCIDLLVFVDAIEECGIVNLNDKPTIDSGVEACYNIDGLFAYCLLLACAHILCYGVYDELAVLNLF